MWTNVTVWIKNQRTKMVNSIAFYPAIIAIIFLVLSVLSISFDFSERGRQIKAQLHWLTLKDATTARSIISSITAGIITLTVFSFSMVMIVLNQTASQLSNRILDKLIGSRFQQVILGIYVGTIVYALFLLSTIRDVDSGIQIPALSTYFLIILTIVDIFLFIYFLHYITQSVKYQVIIHRIFKETKSSLEHCCKLQQSPAEAILFESECLITASNSGTYQGFDKRFFLRISNKNDCILYLMESPGTFILKGMPVIKVNKTLPAEVIKEIQKELYLQPSESIKENFYFGFRQLMELALKALSPGINDPGTAIQSLRALFELYAYRVCYFPENNIKNKDMQVRIILNELTFEQIFEDTLFPIWDYGKNDRLVQHELHHLLSGLLTLAPDTKIVRTLLQKVKLQMKDPSD
ncbi:MAG: DUF2254 domain-containing protein [Bacteroidota bacterium]|nr:DUF2254 domain-containing protein [Bacteroidota bacterium]